MSQNNGRMPIKEAKKIDVGRWVRYISVDDGACDAIIVGKATNGWVTFSPADKATHTIDFDQILQEGDYLFAIKTGLTGCFSSIGG